MNYDDYKLERERRAEIESILYNSSRNLEDRVSEVQKLQREPSLWWEPLTEGENGFCDKCRGMGYFNERIEENIIEDQKTGVITWYKKVICDCERGKKLEEFKLCYES